PATPEERPIIAERGFIPTISSLEEAQAFDRLQPVSVNFKIDTGMGRMGVVQNEAREVLDRKSSRLISSHRTSSYAVFCLKKKKGRRRVRQDGFGVRHPGRASPEPQGADGPEQGAGRRRRGQGPGLAGPDECCRRRSAHIA